MSKWYEVVIETHKVIVVEVDDAETANDAQRYAMDEVFKDGDVSVKECDLISKEAVEATKLSADEVLSI